MERPYEARRATSAWMRTAGRMPPSTDTWPTPLTVDKRWAMSVSARSLRSRIDTMSDVSARVTTAASAGFTLA